MSGFEEWWESLGVTESKHYKLIELFKEKLCRPAWEESERQAVKTGRAKSEWPEAVVSIAFIAGAIWLVAIMLRALL